MRPSWRHVDDARVDEATSPREGKGRESRGIALSPIVDSWTVLVTLTPRFDDKSHQERLIFHGNHGFFKSNLQEARISWILKMTSVRPLHRGLSHQPMTYIHQTCLQPQNDRQNIPSLAHGQCQFPDSLCMVPLPAITKDLRWIPVGSKSSENGPGKVEAKPETKAGTKTRTRAISKVQSPLRIMAVSYNLQGSTDLAASHSRQRQYCCTWQVLRTVISVLTTSGLTVLKGYAGHHGGDGVFLSLCLRERDYHRRHRQRLLATNYAFVNSHLRVDSLLALPT
jgi:hypothetical protein